MSQNSFNRGQSDAQRGRGPASQQNRPYQEREKYVAGYSQQKQQNQGGKS